MCWTQKSDFSEKDKNKTECCEIWSEYYTCKGCEDEMNRKGNLTKHQEAVHEENVKNYFNFEKLIMSVSN